MGVEEEVWIEAEEVAEVVVDHQDKGVQEIGLVQMRIVAIVTLHGEICAIDVRLQDLKV